MLASELTAILAPFAQLANRHALSNVYRALYITPDKVRGCAPWGILEADAELGVSAPFWIDAAHFIAVVRSLPEDDVQLELKGGGLVWSCGMADGKLALLGDMKFPEVSWKPLSAANLWEPPKSFLAALQLGALSCGAMSMASAGVYGVIINNTDAMMTVESSDNVTIALCEACETIDAFPEKTVLVPDALNLMIAILKTKSKESARVEIMEKALYVGIGGYKLMLRPAPSLKHDLRALIDNFSAHETVVEIPRERIAAFIKRASALAEAKQHTYVILRVVEGALSLSFSEGTATSDEYYLADALEGIPEMPEIKLDAARVARVLAHADKIALDHIERGVLVFFGEDPVFQYMISGSQQKS